MKSLILATMVSLMVPAYAQQGPDDATCDELSQASDRIGDLITASRKKELPLSDTDKADMKQALEQFDKAMKDFYAIDKKIAKKKGHPKLKAIGQGIMATAGVLGRAGAGGYGNYGYAPSMLPSPQSMMPTTFMTPSGFVNVQPMGFNTYSVSGLGLH